MMASQDSRNVTDEFKNWSEVDIIAELDKRGVELEIAIENLERDFNIGSIVRTANAFGIRHVHVVGRKQWNKRGAMATDRYLHVHYHKSVSDFLTYAKGQSKHIVAIDNVEDAGDLVATKLPSGCVLVFGSEKSGLSPEMLGRSDSIVAIRQTGSTRSLNVGAAAAIAMFEWVRQQGI